LNYESRIVFAVASESPLYFFLKAIACKKLITTVRP